MKERHSILTNADLNTTARHEAGHLLMLWLLDRHAIGCVITEEGGLTKALDDKPGEKETPHQRILYAMSGMVLAGDFLNGGFGIKLTRRCLAPNNDAPFCKVVFLSNLALIPLVAIRTKYRWGNELRADIRLGEGFLFIMSWLRLNQNFGRQRRLRAKATWDL